MQIKIWYYEKWVGCHASFPPRRFVKWNLMCFYAKLVLTVPNLTTFCFVILHESRIPYVSEDVEEQIWKPNIYIYNLNKFRSQTNLNGKPIHSCSAQKNEDFVTITVSDRFEVSN